MITILVLPGTLRSRSRISPVYLTESSHMPDYTEKKCPKCGQQLRFPTNVGGRAHGLPDLWQRVSF